MNVPGVDFINSYNKYRLANLIGVDDWTDRLSYVYSFVLFFCSTCIVTSKIYLLRPIACHVQTVPSGDKFKQYVESFCWVMGTIPLRPNETFPDREQEWEQMSEDRRINYYQWIPFVLGLQCIMFYLPHLIWSTISFNHLGIDLHVLISKALSASASESQEAKLKAVNQVAQSLTLLLFTNQNRRIRQTPKHMSKLGCFFGVGKRLGNQTVFLYFCIKILYLVNSILQLFLMKELLGYDSSIFDFGIKLGQSLVTDSDWSESLYFPRVAYCPIHIRHLGKGKNFYVGVCALPINMFNEKIYIALYFWVLGVMILTLFGFLIWLQRLTTSYRRTSLIRKYLYLHCQSEIESSRKSPRGSCDSINERIDRFSRIFLRVDGVFLIYILTLNAGDIVTADVVKLLWRIWEEKYADMKDVQSGSDSELVMELDHLNFSPFKHFRSAGELPNVRQREPDLEHKSELV